ncbi:MAG: 3-hydroxy-5-phosphonooxypentane-2,4-dione thiolase LsrF, partial [Candidatus Nitrosocosmicus sp.]
DGASGVDMGRNIWQSDQPIAMIKAVKSIVHENYSLKEAYDLFLEESKPEKIPNTI